MTKEADTRHQPGEPPKRNAQSPSERQVFLFTTRTVNSQVVFELRPFPFPLPPPDSSQKPEPELAEIAEELELSWMYFLATERGHDAS